MAEFLVFVVFPIALSVGLASWASFRPRPRWPRVALGLGYLHGVFLWTLFVLAEWHPGNFARDAAIAALAIALVGAIVAGAHLLLAGLVVQLLRRFRPGIVTGTRPPSPGGDRGSSPR